ncbi:hypothetical protein YC2023_098381 [Brassica napus]
MKRPSPEPISGFKRDLSAFHKAQNQANWSRKYQDAINFSKPAKMTSIWEKVLICTSTQEIRRISLPINLPYLAASTLNYLDEFLQIFAQDQWPYSSSKNLRSISGRLLNRGIIQKLSRYKIIQVSSLKAQIKLTASFHGAIKAFDSKHFISIYFLSLRHF